MNETNLLREIMLAASRDGARLWRNNVGQAWVGNRVDRLADGCVLIHNARPFHAGLAPGSADLIGLCPVIITPEHVGARLAVFLSVEGKSKRGPVRTEQAKWRDAINDLGGRAGIARSVEDALKIIGS